MRVCMCACAWRHCPLQVPFAMGDVACGSGYPIQSNASCWARRYGIVVAINSCEAAAEGNYNVELVYNATGALVAKYRKVHPWYTKCFVTPATPDYIVAPLPFGNFGIFTCFDIMWPTPGPVLVNQYGIRHFIYSAAIPLIGSAAEALWSDVHGSLLLSSNLMDGQSGVFVNGTRLTPVPASGQDVIMFANISA
ncbi:hypothetical protein EON62_01280 [archaeon]|nr:MAG: hypothetical protein EON62_01280 [archaeon]